jgi:hypothetical protein
MRKQFSYFFFLFGSTGVWTQGLALVMQMFFHLSHVLALFAQLFLRQNLVLCPGWPGFLLFALPRIAGMTGKHHRVQPLVEMGSWELFAWSDLEPQSSWSLSSHQVERIIGLSYSTDLILFSNSKIRTLSSIYASCPSTSQIISISGWGKQVVLRYKPSLD